MDKIAVQGYELQVVTVQVGRGYSDYYLEHNSNRYDFKFIELDQISWLVENPDEKFTEWLGSLGVLEEPAEDEDCWYKELELKERRTGQTFLRRNPNGSVMAKEFQF